MRVQMIQIQIRTRIHHNRWEGKFPFPPTFGLAPSAEIRVSLHPVQQTHFFPSAPVASASRLPRNSDVGRTWRRFYVILAGALYSFSTRIGDNSTIFHRPLWNLGHRDGRVYYYCYLLLSLLLPSPLRPNLVHKVCLLSDLPR